MSDRIEQLAKDPIIVQMTRELVVAGVAPADAGDEFEAEYVFSAAVTFLARGGDITDLEPEAPAMAVRLAYADMTGQGDLF